MWVSRACISEWIFLGMVLGGGLLQLRRSKIDAGGKHEGGVVVVRLCPGLAVVSYTYAVGREIKNDMDVLEVGEAESRAIPTTPPEGLEHFIFAFGWLQCCEVGA